MRDDLAGMPPAEPIEWYQARDGSQCGPLSDDEMRRFRELGHLRPDDLPRQIGFSWMPARAVFAIGKKGEGGCDGAEGEGFESAQNIIS
jgi:GYF domain 2